jgi:hypothetical protein
MAPWVLALVNLLLNSSIALAKGPYPWSIPVVERLPHAEELLAYPGERQDVGVNPPGFCWTPHDQAKAYQLEVTKLGEASRKVIQTSALPSTAFAPARPLAPGKYSWRVFYLEGGGVAFGTSRTRTFTVRPGLPELPMPDLARLKAELAGVHPRLLLAGERLGHLRKVIADGRVSTWKTFVEPTDRALEEKPYPEPRRSATGSAGSQWLQVFRAGKGGSARLVRLALACRITGDPKYLEGARQWLMALASWDARGITSYRLPQPGGGSGNDEAAMPMLERMSLAWEWIGDQLSPSERSKVLAAMRERSN